MRALWMILATLALAVVGTGCSSTPKPAQNVWPTSATLVGEGSSACGKGGSYQFEYATSIDELNAGNGTATTRNPFSETPGACLPTPLAMPMSANIVDLQPSTTYYYRICGRDDDEETDTCTLPEDVLSLTTDPIHGGPLRAKIRTARNVLSTSAELTAAGGSVCGAGGSFRFEYSTVKADVEAGTGTATPTRTFDELPGACVDPQPNLPFTEPVTGLASDTTYFYRICGKNVSSSAEVCSTITRFTTKAAPSGEDMPYITVSGNKLMAGDEEFRFIGFNGDENHAWNGYLQHPSPVTYTRMTRAFDHMRAIGATVARVHLQLFDFIDAEASSPGDLHVIPGRFEAFSALAREAQERGVYLDVIGNNVWLIDQSPRWYDFLGNEERWDVQEFFFRRLAEAGKGYASILCYELTNEPAVGATSIEQPFIDPETDEPIEEDSEAAHEYLQNLWYGGEMGGYHFTTRIANGIPAGQQAAVANQWMTRHQTAIREIDPVRLVTVGGLPFNGGPFGPNQQAAVFDLLSVHIYPQGPDHATATAMAAAYAAPGKPMFVGETSSFQASGNAFDMFLTDAAPYVSGIVSFFPGVGPDDARVHPGQPEINFQVGLSATRSFVDKREHILAPPP